MIKFLIIHRHLKKKNTIFGHATWLAGSEFPGQGLNSCPWAVKTHSPKHWTTREFLQRHFVLLLEKDLVPQKPHCLRFNYKDQVPWWVTDDCATGQNWVEDRWNSQEVSSLNRLLKVRVQNELSKNRQDANHSSEWKPSLTRVSLERGTGRIQVAQSILIFSFQCASGVSWIKLTFLAEPSFLN